MKTRRSIYILAVLFVFASMQAFSQSIKLEYKFIPDKKYLLESQMTQDITQSMMGQEVKVNLKAETVSQLDIQKVNADGSAHALYTFKKIVVNQQVMGKDTTIVMDNLDVKYAALIDAKGKMLEFRRIDTTQSDFAKGVDQFSKNMKLMLLPGNTVNAGEKWPLLVVDSIKPGETSPLEMVTSTNYEGVFAGNVTENGKEYSKITMEGPVTITGKGNQMGMDLVADGTGKMKTAALLDKATHMAMYQETDMGLDITIAVSAMQDMTIPVTQNGKVIMKITELQ